VKTLALAALLATAATAAPAAVTIHFTGTTFEGGSYSYSTAGGYDFAPATYAVEGTLLIDTDNVNNGPFLTASFTSFGGTSPVMLLSGVADDLLEYDADPDFGTAGLTFAREFGPGEGVHQDSVLYLYFGGPLPLTLGGLPDFAAADLSLVTFSAYDTNGTNEDYFGRYSVGQVTSLQVIEDAPAVPEPASWAMMVGGFGLIGGAMRRRRVSVSFAG
jgi:hypothetical protein